MRTTRFRFLVTVFFGSLLVLEGSLLAGLVLAGELQDYVNKKLRPMKGIAYSPAPSDDAQMHGHGMTPNPNMTYFDTDFYNDDFMALWSNVDVNMQSGRNDLDTMKNAGINFLHLYNWNGAYGDAEWGRDHNRFLDAANEKGIKVWMPISNYTHQIINNQVGPENWRPRGYADAYKNIKGIFDAVYRGGKTPHPAVVMWDIYNEYDITDAGKNPYDPAEIAFIAQAIITLENEAGISKENRLPITSPTSAALMTKVNWEQQIRHAQPSWFADEELTYRQRNNNADPTMGLLANMVLSTAFKKASESGKTTYQNQFGQAQQVAAMPADFWKTRYIASVNVFKDPKDYYNYVTDPKQFQSAFPGTNDWNTLPPMFFAEMGWNTRDYQLQADWVLGQLKCTNSLAVDASKTPNGYFFGTNIFEFSYTGTDGDWGMFVFTAPDPPFAGAKYETRKTKSKKEKGIEYRMDTLVPQPVWNSVKTGFQVTDVNECLKLSH